MSFEKLTLPQMAEPTTHDEIVAYAIRKSPASVRRLAQMRPDRWVEHLAELALMSELASRLEDDYRALVRSAEPAPR